MTEEQWLACTDPREMLTALRAGGLLPERKARLFAAACCRRAWGRLRDERSRRAVEVAERFADGQATAKERTAARKAAREVSARDTYAGAPWYAASAAWHAAESRALAAACKAAEAVAWDAGQKARPSVREAQVALLRDIIGNPSRPVTLSPAWQSPQVVALAQAAYDHRDLPSGHLDPTRLAVLADALEEAGCGQADLLGHLRGPGPHVRGCWVVDLVLDALRRWR
jgi:hypothetical protein